MAKKDVYQFDVHEVDMLINYNISTESDAKAAKTFLSRIEYYNDFLFSMEQRIVHYRLLVDDISDQQDYIMELDRKRRDLHEDAMKAIAGLNAMDQRILNNAHVGIAPDPEQFLEEHGGRSSGSARQAITDGIARFVKDWVQLTSMRAKYSH